jgi:hypothetical protein
MGGSTRPQQNVGENKSVWTYAFEQVRLFLYSRQFVLHVYSVSGLRSSSAMREMHEMHVVHVWILETDHWGRQQYFSSQRLATRIRSRYCFHANVAPNSSLWKVLKFSVLEALKPFCGFCGEIFSGIATGPGRERPPKQSFG